MTYMLVENQNGLRMYFFVMYNLSGIQKGIQAGHAALEYATEYGHTKLYKDFIDNHKTFILLDGGGSNDILERAYDLVEMGIPHSVFHEPDLNNSMSAIAFILPESAYDCKLDEVDMYNQGFAFDQKAYDTYQYIRKFRLASN